MPNILKLGISSCLLDNCVPYDGGHRLDLHVKQTLGRIVGWVAVCPEVECGLGVPREPTRLVDDRKEIRLETIDSRQDKTGIFSLWLPQKLKELESTGQAGFVLKARSPSCGVRDTALFDPYGREKGRGAGLFCISAAEKVAFASPGR